MKLIDILLKTNKRIYILIFLTALFTRVIIYVSSDNSYIFPDSYMYHSLAVNLAEGNGYSSNSSAPYEPNFLREPAYPFFMSVVYRIYHEFGELTITPFNKIKLNKNGELLFAPNELLWIRVIQILLSSLSCIFFYLILLYVFKPNYALLIALLFAIYFPYSYHDLFILRESLQSFLAIMTNFIFINYLKKNKIAFIILFGVFWGLLILTIQTSLVIGFFFPSILLISTRNFKKTLLTTLIATCSMLVTVSPFLLRTYKFYPDIRVFRSMGSSITLEQVNYSMVLEELKGIGVIPQHEYNSLYSNLWYLSAYKTFQKSFNGEFNKLAIDLKEKYPVPANAKFKYRIKNVISNAGKTWFKNFYKNPPVSFLVSLKNFDLLILIPHIISIIFGLFAFFGFIIYFKNTYQILIIFFSIISLFFIIGGESRHALPAHPYIFMFATIAFITVYYSFKKNSFQDIKFKLFRS
jgi:hypothetical protein